MKTTERQWVKDYNDFLDADEVHVPEELSRNILTEMKRRILPSSFQVFLKLLMLHLPIGILSLLICDQFGMSPFDTNFSLARYLMFFGHSFCMFLCGSFFIGGSILISGFVLNPFEVRALKRKSYLQSFFLAGFSYGVFLMLGAGISVGIAILWVLGATLGGVISIRTIYTIRILNA